MKKFEVRMLEDNKSFEVVGYALTFENESKDMGFYEIIDKNALDNCSFDNCILTINHDDNKILARNNVNLKLEKDEKGLKFIAVVSNETSYAHDLYVNMKNNLLSECSFRFCCNKDEWNFDNEEHYTRRILEISEISDVSIVTTPAYSNTNAMILERALKDKEKNEKLLNNKKEIELLKIKYNYL